MPALTLNQLSTITKPTPAMTFDSAMQSAGQPTGTTFDQITGSSMPADTSKFDIAGNALAILSPGLRYLARRKDGNADPNALDEINDTLYNHKLDALKDIPQVLGQAPGRITAGIENAMAGGMRYLGNENPSADSIYNTDQNLVDTGKELSQQADTRIKDIEQVSPTKTYVGKVGNMVTSSVGQMLPALAAGIASGGLGFTVDAAIFLPTFGAKFNELMNKGLTGDQAASRAIWEGMTEAGTERIGLQAVTHWMKNKGGFKNFLWETLTKEVPSEHLATALQNSFDEQNMNKDMFDPSNLKKSWDYLWSSKHMSDQIDTFFTTVGMSAGFGAMGKIAHPRTQSPTLGQTHTMEKYEGSVKDAKTLEELQQARGVDITQSFPIQPPAFGEEVGGAPGGVQPNEYVSKTLEEQRQAVLDQSLHDVLTNQITEGSPSPAAPTNLGETQQQLGDTVADTMTQQPAVGNETNLPPMQSGQEGQVPGEGQTAVATPMVGIAGQLDSLPTAGVGLETLLGGEAAGGVGKAKPQLDPLMGHFESSMASKEIGSSIINTPSIPDKIANVIERVQSKLGFKNKTLMIGSDELANTAFGQYISGLIEDQNVGQNPRSIEGGKFFQNITDPKTGKTFHVAAIDSRVLSDDFITSTIAVHEALGHAVDYEHFASAPQGIKDYIAKQFEEAFTKIDPSSSDTHKSFFSADALELVGVEGAKGILSQRAGESSEQYKQRMFAEWKAHQIVKALQSSKPAGSIIERFWHDLAQKIKELYSAFKGNNLDLVTGVKSIRDFVDYLYNQKDDVRNLNINSPAKYKSILLSAWNRMTEVSDEGKISVKLEFLQKNDTSKVVGLRRFLKRYYSKENGFTSGSLSQGVIGASPFSIKASGTGASKVWNIYGPVTKGSVLKSEVIFTIPYSSFPSAKGLSKSNAAWYVAQNLRDLLIISEATKISQSALASNNIKETISQVLESSDGKKLTIKVPAIQAKLTGILEHTTRLAEELGQSTLQTFTELLAGQHNQFNLNPGIRGTDRMTDNQANRSLVKIWDDVSKLATEYPGLFEQLYQTMTPNVLAMQEVKAVEEERMSPENEVAQIDPELQEVESKVFDLVTEAFNRRKGSLKDFQSLLDHTTQRIEIGGLDYNEISKKRPEIANYIDASVKQLVGELEQEKIVVDLQSHDVSNKIKQELKEVQLANLGWFKGDNDLRVYHGTSKVIEDVPTMEFAQPGLYGKGIYTTEDSVDAETGHLIVTAGYAGAPKEFISTAHKFDAITDYYDKIDDEKSLRSFRSAHPFDTDTNLYLNAGVISELYQKLGLEERPNILPLEIDPDPKRTFDLDKLYTIHTMPDSFRNYIQEHLANRSDSPKELLWDLDIRGNLLHSWLTSALVHANRGTGIESNDAVRQGFVDLGIDWFTHKGGAITGGVSHKVWIALKDGLIKSAFDVQPGLKIINVPNNATDSLTQSVFEKMYDNELALAKHKKKTSLKNTTEGPYTAVLKDTPKEKKKKPRTKVDPIKQRERQDKLNQFVLAMRTLESEAHRTGKSLAEFMQSQGTFTPDEIRKNISKYQANVSLFSQNEIVMRLASELGLVNEEGREGLATVIQTLFPDREGDALDPANNPILDLKGKVVKKKYKGSDGSLVSLGPVAKDILIHNLQTMMVQSTGERLDIEAQQTVAQRKDELKKLEDARPVWKKAIGLVKWFERNNEMKLTTTQAGKELAYRLKKYLWKTIDYQRDWILQLDNFARLYSTPEQRDHLYKLLTGDVIAKTKSEQNFIDLIKTINVATSSEMALLQVKIQYRNGTSEFYRHNIEDAESYFPHMWEPGSFDKPNERMIQSLIDSHETIDRSQALKLIKKYKSSYIRAQRFANIEMARETLLDGWMTDPIKVYQKYVTQSAKRLAQLKEFGATPDLALAQFAIKHFKEGQDSEALNDARDIINETLRVRVEEALAKDPKFGLTYGIMISTGLLLQHAFIVQPGTIMNMTMVGGLKNTVVGMAKIIANTRNEQNRDGSLISTREYAKLAGVLAFTMNKELYDIVLDDKIREKSDKILRSFGVTQVDSAMRLVGAMTGKLYAIEEAIKYAHRQTPKGYERLRYLGLNPDSIVNREQPGILNAEELRQSALAFTEDTNFVSNSLGTPVMLKNHPLGKIFFLFSRFVFQQHHLWKRVIKDSKGKALKGILTGMTVGIPLMLLKMLLQGDDPEKMLERDGVAKMLWKSFTTGGGPGLFVEALGNAIFQATGKQTGAGGANMALDSPALGIMDTLGKGIKASSKIAFTDDYTDSDVNKALKGAMVALQATLLSIPKVGVGLNAVVGMSRPAIERKFYPSERQKEVTYLQ